MRDPVSHCGHVKSRYNKACVLFDKLLCAARPTETNDRRLLKRSLHHDQREGIFPGRQKENIRSLIIRSDVPPMPNKMHNLSQRQPSNFLLHLSNHVRPTANPHEMDGLTTVGATHFVGDLEK